MNEKSLFPTNDEGRKGVALSRPRRSGPQVANDELPEEGLKSWALVELYGHQRIVGHVTADPVELPGMIRVDVPDLIKDGKVVRPGFTRYFGKNALYSLTPVDEKTVREMLPHVDGLPARQASFGSYRGDEL